MGCARDSAVTIGNFDGCHLGHQRLTSATVELAQKLNLATVAITFNPRPEAFFRRLTCEPLLFTEAQKSRALGELGIDYQLIQSFDAAFSKVTHSEFYEAQIRQNLKAAALVVGDDFHFGFQRLGDIDFLRSRANVDGLKLEIGSAVKHSDQRVSSTRIRETIRISGDVTNAALMLGRPYLLEGAIQKGDQIGRKLGFPTANLGSVGQLTPKRGVYAGYVWLCRDNQPSNLPPVTNLSPATIPAIFNIGIRPSLGQEHPPTRIEANLLTGEYAPDSLYGLHAGYYFTHRLRDERTFPDLDRLKSQIRNDADQARHLLGIR
jgi:riboflavin kinase / FMN adenylyltransferase